MKNFRWQHDNHERGAFVVWDVMQKEQDMVSTEWKVLSHCYISKCYKALQKEQDMVSTE